MTQDTVLLVDDDQQLGRFTAEVLDLAGFNVELARLLCAEIKASCTIQMRRFETLVNSLAANRGDAIIASMSVTPQLRAQVDFTDPYYRVPGRFVARKDGVLAEMRPEFVEGKKVGVIAGSAILIGVPDYDAPGNGDFRAIFNRFEADPSKALRQLENSLNTFRTGNGKAPSFS